MEAPSLHSRADEMGLSVAELTTWEARVDRATIEALLAALIRFGDALFELSQ